MNSFLFRGQVLRLLAPVIGATLLYACIPEGPQQTIEVSQTSTNSPQLSLEPPLTNTVEADDVSPQQTIEISQTPTNSPQLSLEPPLTNTVEADDVSPQQTIEISQTPTNSPQLSLGSSPIVTVESDMVQLQLDRSIANPGLPITIIVKNNSAFKIGTYDHKSLCSIFTIQKEDRSEWENILECTLRKPTLPVFISPGESISLTFNEDSSTPNSSELEPGVYRVEFAYKQTQNKDDLASDDIPWIIVHSPPFTIN